MSLFIMKSVNSDKTKSVQYKNSIDSLNLALNVQNCFSTFFCDQSSYHSNIYRYRKKTSTKFYLEKETNCIIVNFWLIIETNMHKKGFIQLNYLECLHAVWRDLSCPVACILCRIKTRNFVNSHSHWNLMWAISLTYKQFAFWLGQPFYLAHSLGLEEQKWFFTCLLYTQAFSLTTWILISLF